MVEVVTSIVGVVTVMVGIVTGMGNSHSRVMHLESLRGRVGVITAVLVDVKFVTGVYVVVEQSMVLGRIPFYILMGIMIALFLLSSLSGCCCSCHRHSWDCLRDGWYSHMLRNCHGRVLQLQLRWRSLGLSQE